LVGARLEYREDQEGAGISEGSHSHRNEKIAGEDDCEHTPLIPAFVITRCEQRIKSKNNCKMHNYNELF